MKKWTAFVGTFILSYLFWILFLMQDFNILKLGAQELIVGAIVAVIVSCCLLYTSPSPRD